jgi:hypothetical protein
MMSLSSRRSLKKDVLRCVSERPRATSRSVADAVGYCRVSGRKAVSLTLLKCRRQGLVNRALTKRGRVREYVYMITERGMKRLRYWRMNGKIHFGSVDLDEIAYEAKTDLTPLLRGASLSVLGSAMICEKTDDQDVFWTGKIVAGLSAFPVTVMEDLVSGAAAARFLKTVSPEAWTTLQNATRKLLSTDVFAVLTEYAVTTCLTSLYQLKPPWMDNATFIFCLAKRRLNETNAGALILYDRLQDKEKEAEMYKFMYESEREWREFEEHWHRQQSVRSLHIVQNSTHKCSSCIACSSYRYGAITDKLQSLCATCRSSWQTITHMDQEIMKTLTRRAQTNFDLVLWLTNFLVASIGENARLRAEITEMKGTTQNISAPLDKPLTPANQQIEMRTSEKADKPSVQQLSSATTATKERASEHTKSEPEREISWDEFNTDWWRSLTT